MIALALADIAATRRLARALAPLLVDRDVVELVGEIGAGKTTFTAALASELGVTEAVRSPTYTVAHAYTRANGEPLAHLDCYRTRGTLDDAAWGDVEPYFERGIAVIEWPEPIRAWLSGRRTWQLSLDAVTTDARIVRVEAPAHADSRAFLRSWATTDLT